MWYGVVGATYCQILLNLLLCVVEFNQVHRVLVLHKPRKQSLQVWRIEILSVQWRGASAKVAQSLIHSIRKSSFQYPSELIPHLKRDSNLQLEGACWLFVCRDQRIQHGHQ